MKMYSPKMVLRKNGVGACRYKLLFLTVLAMQVMVISETYAVTMRNLSEDRHKNALLLYIEQPAFHVDDIKAISGKDVPVRITLPSATEFAQEGGTEGAFILIRNVPLSVSLSAGLPSGRNWVITLGQAKSLRLASMPDTIGEFHLDFDLIGPKKRKLGQHTVAVTILPPQKEIKTAAIPREIEKTPKHAVTAITSEAVDPAPSNRPPLPKKEEEILLKRGNEILRQGGIAGARLIFEELAIHGSRKGAFALAQTYDPAFIKSLPGLGLSVNIEKALKWYDRAAELGHTEAKLRYIELGAGQ